jgi:hypothetical protein
VAKIKPTKPPVSLRTSGGEITDTSEFQE